MYQYYYSSTSTNYLTITSWSDPITFVCVLLIDKILLVPFCDIIIDIDGMLTIPLLSLLISLVSSIIYYYYCIRTNEKKRLFSNTILKRRKGEIAACLLSSLLQNSLADVIIPLIGIYYL